MPPFQILLHPWLQKKKVARSKAGQVRGWDTNTISFLAKNYWMLKAVWAGALSWCKNQSPLCHFSGPFITGSHAVVSTHSSKTADLPFILEEQTPCALYHQYQKNKSSLDTWVNLLHFFWSGWIWWLPVTWLLLWLRVIAVAPTLIIFYNFCEKLRVLFELFLQIMANIHMLIYNSTNDCKILILCSCWSNYI